MPRETTLHCPLDALGYIEVGGRDAEAFLQAQLGRDVGTLGNAAALAAWSDARGRVRALVRVLRRPSGFLLLLPAAHAAPIAAKLAMFVLRADVTVDATTRWSGFALLGPPPESIDAHVGNGDAVHIAIDEQLGYVISTAAVELDALRDGLMSGTAATLELAEIERGLPSIGPQTAERYLPQMLNLDRLDGMSFDKGCYPGQEVIARTQNLGTVKRRLARFAVEAGNFVPATTEVTAQGIVIGEVLRSAAENGRSELLAVVRTESLEQTSALHADADALERLALPY